MAEYISYSTEETEGIASSLASELKKGDFVAMFGDLGVGKTAFVRGMARVLAPTASVKSPTYTVVNEYRGEGIKLFHFDVYRIEDDDDLYSIGFYDYIRKGISVCEWSENIPWAIPDNARRVIIERMPDDVNKRKITII
ncbi:MAG: tRNA (adenosine(37)-N6)-threonylcarbamoyltransferase complex ATPase subunit type 1 TsaE [Clostridia bacterium]|nr:tRNA (adenosine(37)-N6)-threonylcarbamoyltransferase complex ATPase subunit type 1 TsaE [Clostridia bacterium]